MLKFILIFTFLSTGMLQAQNLVPYTKNKLWGFCDQQKNVIIAPKYKRVDFFQDGLARVLSAENDRYGIINEKDEVIVPFEYHSILVLGTYSQDRIFFKEGDLFGYFNGKGEVVITPQFDFVYTFFKGRSNIPAMKDGKYGIIDIDGNTITSFEYPAMSMASESGYVTFYTDAGNGIMDLSGNLIVPAKYREKKMHKKVPIPTLKQNFARLRRKDGAKDYSLIFNNGEKLLYYTSVENFKNDHFYLNKYLLVNKPNLKAFSSSERALVDIDGNAVLTWDNYPYVGAYNDNAVVVGKKKGNDIIYGLINTKGETILKPKYEKIEQFDANGIARFVYKGKSGFLNDRGKIVQAEKDFEGISSFGFSENGLIYFKGDVGGGIMTYEGKIIYKHSDQYQYFFSEFGLIRRKDKQHKKEALMDRGGQVLTDEYSSIDARAYGFQTKLDGKKGVLDKTGKVVLAATYQHIDYIRDGFFIIKQDNSKTLISLTGEQLLKGSYKDIRLISGKDIYWIKNAQYKWQVVDSEGQPLNDQLYNKIEYFRDGLYNVKTDKWGVVDSSGKEVVPTVCKHAMKYVKSDVLLGVIKQGSVIYGYIGKDYSMYWD